MFALAICCELTSGNQREAGYAYPTSASAIQYAVMIALRTEEEGASLSDVESLLARFSGWHSVLQRLALPLMR